MKRINWSKIDIITYSGEFMGDECKAEVNKAHAILNECNYHGDYKKAAYVRRRLEDKKNYIER